MEEGQNATQAREESIEKATKTLQKSFKQKQLKAAKTAKIQTPIAPTELTLAHGFFQPTASASAPIIAPQRYPATLFEEGVQKEKASILNELQETGRRKGLVQEVTRAAAEDIARKTETAVLRDTNGELIITTSQGDHMPLRELINGLSTVDEVLNFLHEHYKLDICNYYLPDSLACDK